MLLDFNETALKCISDYKMECIISKVHESDVLKFLFYIFASVAGLDSPCKGLQMNDYGMQMLRKIHLQTIC